MANLTETANWDSGVYQVETTDPVSGGVNGIANKASINLANRTKYLKNSVDLLEAAVSANSVSPKMAPWLVVGDGRASDIAGIRAAIEANPGKAIYLPNGVYGDGTDVLYITVSTVLMGERMPTFNYTTMQYENGTVIKAVIAGAGDFAGVGFKNIGIDAQGVTLTEGISLAGSTNGLRNVYAENVSVATNVASNHCFLIEHATNVYGRNIETIGGIQGLAVKADNVDIEGTRHFDQTTWGLTIRYSPGAVTRHGSVRKVLCAKVNRTKGGGVICMNSQSGAALADFSIDDVRIISGAAGLYVDNSSNTTPARNLKFGRVYIEDVQAYGVQTFGPCESIHFDDVHFKGCDGTFYNNGAATATDHTYTNIKVENTAAPALLSGNRHIVSGWKKIGGVGGWFVQNESTDLQVYDMDANVIAVANQGGGTTLGGSGSIGSIGVNGALAARTVLFNQSDFKTALMGQYGFITLYTLPSADSHVQMDLNVIVLSSAGYNVRSVNISDTVITYNGSSTYGANVFEIDRSGALIRLRYIWDILAAVGATTEVVYVDYFYTVSHES